ncbi:MAG: saccharopine dehydrogenase C-terminal domain-containing protein [Thermoplasmata archaeon]
MTTAGPEPLWDPSASAGPRVDSIPSSRVLLVGCGAIGTVIARQLAQSPCIGQLVLTDIDPHRAQIVAASTDRRTVHAQPLDGGDPQAVANALENVEVVVNCSVPRLNAPIQRAALAAGAHYLDLAADSVDPYHDSAAWIEAGRTALIGMGEDPGLSNLMARHAADGLERVESVRVRDGDTASSVDHPFLALFSPETFIEETLHASRIFEDGVYRDVPPFGEREVYTFPSPLGDLPVYSVDHEEVDSLPRFLGKGVAYVDFKLALDDPTVRALQLFQSLKIVGPDAAANPELRRAILAAIPRPADLTGRVEGYAALMVEVVGEAKGRRKEHTLFTLMRHRDASAQHGATATAYLTGTPAAIAVELLASGSLSTRGILAPEMLDPALFFPKLRERGIVIQERVTWQGTVN